MGLRRLLCFSIGCAFNWLYVSSLQQLLSGVRLVVSESRAVFWGTSEWGVGRGVSTHTQLGQGEQRGNPGGRRG